MWSRSPPPHLPAPPPLQDVSTGARMDSRDWDGCWKCFLLPDSVTFEEQQCRLCVGNNASYSDLAAAVLWLCALLPGWTSACTCSPSRRRPLAALYAGLAPVVLVRTCNGNGQLCFQNVWLRARARPPSTATSGWGTTPCAWWTVGPRKNPRSSWGRRVGHTLQTHSDWTSRGPSLQENIQHHQFHLCSCSSGFTTVTVAFQGLYFDLVASSGHETVEHKHVHTWVHLTGIPSRSQPRPTENFHSLIHPEFPFCVSACFPLPVLLHYYIRTKLSTTWIKCVWNLSH